MFEYQIKTYILYFSNISSICFGCWSWYPTKTFQIRKFLSHLSWDEQKYCLRLKRLRSNFKKYEKLTFSWDDGCINYQFTERNHRNKRAQLSFNYRCTIIWWSWKLSIQGSFKQCNSKKKYVKFKLTMKYQEQIYELSGCFISMSLNYHLIF